MHCSSCYRGRNFCGKLPQVFVALDFKRLTMLRLVVVGFFMKPWFEATLAGAPLRQDPPLLSLLLMTCWSNKENNHIQTQTPRAEHKARSYILAIFALWGIAFCVCSRLGLKRVKFLQPKSWELRCNLGKNIYIKFYDWSMDDKFCRNNAVFEGRKTCAVQWQKMKFWAPSGPLLQHTLASSCSMLKLNLCHVVGLMTVLLDFDFRHLWFLI